MKIPYLNTLLQAKLNGYYIPEIEVVYLREDNFRIPRALLCIYE
jgi:hypothetical protein